jgi:hypothetical protein
MTEPVASDVVLTGGGTPNLNKALSAFQGEIKSFTAGEQRTVTITPRDAAKDPYSYSYATLATMLDKAGPLMAKHGLSFSSMPTYADPGDGKITLVLAYTLAHSSGEERNGMCPLKHEGSIQSLGGVITFIRRYCQAAALGLAAEQDDDGMAAMLDSGDEAGGIRAQARGNRRAAPAARPNRPAQRPTPAAAETLPGGDPVTGGGNVPSERMRSAMFAALNTWKGPQLRDERLALVSQIVGRPIASSDELTKEEVGLILTTANAGTENPPEPGEPQERAE